MTGCAVYENQIKKRPAIEKEIRFKCAVKGLIAPRGQSVRCSASA